MNLCSGFSPPLWRNAMKRIRFLHIPKTGGSTFIAILHRQYFGKKSFKFNGGALVSDIKRFKALSKRDRKNIALFTGHAPIVTSIKEADNATIITFLRDPISRVKSFCQHVSEGKSPIKGFHPKSFNLDRFLKSGNPALSNLQTKMLINNRTCASPLLIESMSTSEARDLALDNLYNKISYFGLQEYFDESLIVMTSALNWEMPVYISENKKNTNKLIKFKKRHLEQIAELNAIDIEVYRLAKKQFIGILNSAAFDKAKLKQLKLINNTPGPSKSENRLKRRKIDESL